MQGAVLSVFSTGKNSLNLSEDYAEQDLSALWVYESQHIQNTNGNVTTNPFKIFTRLFLKLSGIFFSTVKAKGRKCPLLFSMYVETINSQILNIQNYF